MAWQAASPRTLGQGDTLTARALRVATAERRIGELESELGLAREELLHRDNKIFSLEESLELNVGENLRLSARLSENSSALNEARHQIEQMRLALTQAKAERDEAAGKLQAELSASTVRLETALARAATAEKLRSELHDQLSENSSALNEARRQIEQMSLKAEAAKAERDEATARLRAELSAMTVRLESTLARAATAEKLRSELYENLRKCTVEHRAAERRIADVEFSLQEKEHELLELKSLQSKLVDEIDERDAALARAGQRIHALSAPFVQREARSSNPKSDKASQRIVAPARYQRTKPVTPGEIDKGSGDAAAVLKRDLDRDAWLFGGRPRPRLS